MKSSEIKAVKHASNDIVKIMSGGVLVWVSEHYANERLEAAIKALPLTTSVQVTESDKFPLSPTSKAGQPIFKPSFMFGGFKIPNFEDVKFEITKRGNFQRAVEYHGEHLTAFVAWNECCLTLTGTQYSKTVYFATRYDKG